jgi:putative colanic acid biosynthesis glycosyltransferase
MNKRNLVSFVTVNKNNADGLSKTLQSFGNLLNLITDRDYQINLIIQDSCSTDNSRHRFNQLNINFTSFYSELDSSIYHGMILGADKANSDFISFMNAGDIINGHGFQAMLDCIYSDLKSGTNSSCYYGCSSWQISLKDKRRRFNPNTIYIWPQLGIMPNHQAMVVATRLCIETSFDYKNYPVAADLDHKIKLAKQSEWKHVNATVCISEADGVSQQMRSLTQLVKRSKEIGKIVSANYSFAHGVTIGIMFFSWNLRKLLPNPLRRKTRP